MFNSNFNDPNETSNKSSTVAFIANTTEGGTSSSKQMDNQYLMSPINASPPNNSKSAEYSTSEKILKKQVSPQLEDSQIQKKALSIRNTMDRLTMELLNLPIFKLKEINHHPKFPDLPDPQGPLENFIGITWYGDSYSTATYKSYNWYLLSPYIV